VRLFFSVASAQGVNALSRFTEISIIIEHSGKKLVSLITVCSWGVIPLEIVIAYPLGKFIDISLQNNISIGDSQIGTGTSIIIYPPIRQSIMQAIYRSSVFTISLGDNSRITVTPLNK